MERARASLIEHGTGVDEEAFARCLAAHAVRGRGLQRPRHLRPHPDRAGRRRSGPPTISPSRPACSRWWRRTWPRPGCARDARVIVEKPFGRDLASARALNADPARGLPRGEHLPHRPLPGQGSGPEHPVLPLRQRVPGADLQPALRRERADHDGGELRGEGPRQVLRGDRGHPRRDPEPPPAGGELPGDGGALLHLRGGHPRRAGEGAAHGAAAVGGPHGARAVPRLSRRAGCGEGLVHGDLRGAASLRRLLALGGRALLRARGQVPQDDLHGGDGRVPQPAPGRLHRAAPADRQLHPLPAEPARRHRVSAPRPSAPARAWRASRSSCW